MAKLSTGQKRRQKELKRRKKKQIQVKKRQALVETSWSDFGLPKLSERLIEFGGELLDQRGADRHFVESAFGFLVMCWNIGTVAADEANKLRLKMNQMLEKITGDLPEDIEEQIDLLITRRRVFYGDDPRYILEYHVHWDFGSDYHVRVLSALLPEEQCYHFSLENASVGLSDKSRSSIATFEQPLTGQEMDVEQLINKGWRCFKDNDAGNRAVTACNLWLEAWEMIKALYQDKTTFRDIDNRLGFFLDFWSSELDTHLLNAARGDAAFIGKGMQFCREFNEQFPDTHEITRLNIQRTGAELHLLAGHIEQGEAEFEALVRDFPEQAWSYIGWGDIYNPVYPMFPEVPADIERARQLYRIPVVRELDNAGEARERLNDLLAYQHNEANILDA